jgi:diguanylate cyclase (GGDEF)-like protein
MDLKNFKSSSGTALSRTLASTETLKLAELGNLDAFYTPLEDRFERLTRLGRSALGARVVAVTVLDVGRQWFKSVIGWKVNELALDASLCKLTVERNQLTVFEDTSKDPDCATHPLVRQSPAFRFYAGVPLRDRHGDVIGTFCAFDTAPKAFPAEKRQLLLDLGTLAERELLTSELWEGYAEVISKLGAARREAMFDPLTRLWNRRGGISMLGVALKALGGGHGETVSVCVADIDNFKRVNDLYGHQAGDQVLRKVAQAMVANLRSCDAVCRLGGDEFLMVLVGSAEAQMREVVDRLRSTIATQPVLTGSGPISISVSFGGVSYPAGTEVSSEEALEDADKALYQSKRAGRNRLSVANA